MKGSATATAVDELERGFPFAGKCEVPTSTPSNQNSPGLAALSTPSQVGLERHARGSTKCPAAETNATARRPPLTGFRTAWLHGGRFRRGIAARRSFAANLAIKILASASALAGMKLGSTPLHGAEC